MSTRAPFPALPEERIHLERPALLASDISKEEFHGAFADFRARPIPDPHQRRIAVGIDLGTTHSLVAAVRNGWLNAC